MPTLDAVAHALAEPNRRAILRLVDRDEQSVAKIASEFSVTRPAISQHLRVLREAGLVDVRVEANRRYYRARPEGMTELRQWLDSFWRNSLSTLKIEVERDVWNRRKEERGHG